jgi:hypothetical protein
VRELAEFDCWCQERPVSVHEAATQAVLEYLPVEFIPSGYRTKSHELEQQLADDLRHAGLLGDSSMKQTGLNERELLCAQEKEKCRIHIDDRLLEPLEKYVIVEEGKARGWVGVYFAEALREYRTCGQSRRLQEWYNRLRENVDFLPSDRQTRTEQILDRIEAELAERDCGYIHQQTIDKFTCELTDAEVDNAIREYRQRVLDKLGFVSVSTGRDVYAPPEVAEEVEADAAMDEITPKQYESMDRGARVEYLQIALRQRAEVNDGSASVTYTDVIEKVFSAVNGPSHTYAYKLMHEAAEESGYCYGEYNGQYRLRFNDNWIGDGADSEQSEYNSVTDNDADEDEWVEAAVGRLKDMPSDIPDAVIDNKIARAHYPDEIDDVEGPPDELLNQITAEQRHLVKARLGWTDDEDGPVDNVRSEMHKLTDEAEQVATDGGDDIESQD